MISGQREHSRSFAPERVINIISVTLFVALNPILIHFRYDYFIVRTLLAVIDHNVHADREQAVNKDGQLIYARKYSKRTKRWHAERVKTLKSYQYFSDLMAMILKQREVDEGKSNRRVLFPEGHPKLISPYIGLKNPPPTSELVKTRFVKME